MTNDYQLDQLSPAKRALYEIRKLRSRVEELERHHDEPIAIIGIGLRFPGEASTPEAFWNVLAGGVDTVTEIPSSRWSVETYYHPDPDAPGKMYTRHGSFIADPALFDAEFFGISAREATMLDPQHRLALEVAWEALENAGCNPGGLAQTNSGVFLALGNSDYHRLAFHRTAEINAYTSTGNLFSVAAGRISYTLGLQGPSLALDTACSGSLVAVHLACQSLRIGECRLALAGGVNLMLSPDININFTKSRMLARDGRCKSFDSAADGYGRGEGCGLLVLKRLSDAEADRDEILAVIRGSAVNQDGRSGGLTVPNGPAQVAVIRAALANARMDPERVGYLETHGTGTALGDPIEAHALVAALGANRSSNNPLVIGSVKTNVGHLEAAAGVAGLIKVVLALQHQEIPPNLHFHELNPHIDWGELPVTIPVERHPWPSGPSPRVAGVSSFGLSGTNAHVIVEEAPVRRTVHPDFERPLHILALSARSGAALDTLHDQYATALAHSSATLADICYTSNAGRAHFQERAVYVGVSRDEILHQPAFRGTVEAKPEVVFLFPGQGAQYAGMAKELYDHQPVFRQAIEECAVHLANNWKASLVDVLWGQSTTLIDQTAYTQPAVFAVEYALAKLWMSWGIQPAAVLGHSVGEYAAATIAGVWSLADGLRLIATRARLMAELPGQGAMAAVMLGEEQVRDAIAPYGGAVCIAALNAPEEVVISGYLEQLQAVCGRLLNQGVRVRPLAVSHAFHSSQMAGILSAFSDAAGNVLFHEPEVPIASSVTGRIVSDREISNLEYWTRQIAKPVRFRDALTALAGKKNRVFLEVGPGTTLLALGKQCTRDEGTVWLPSLRKGYATWPQILDSLGRLYVAGADIDWAGFDKPYGRRKVVLPTYPFERRRYWIEADPAAAIPTDSHVWESVLESAGRQSRQCPMDLQLATYAERWRILDQLTLAYIGAALRGFGLFMNAAERQSASSLMQELGIPAGYRKLIGRWLVRAASAGLLEREGDEFLATAPLPEHDITALLAEAKRIFETDHIFLDYVEWCGERLRPILTGRLSPLETLFPGGDFTRAEDLYERAPLSQYFSAIARAAVEGFVRSHGDTPLRLLEIGAGTGATTAAVLPVLRPTIASYSFTDVSQWFLDHGARKFAAYPFVRFGILDIDLTGASQGHPDGFYDIILATNALHATRDILATLRNVRSLLAPGGILVLCEATTYLPWFDITTALIEGWQAFNDNCRGDHPLLSAESWRKALLNSGFERCEAYPATGSMAEQLGQHVILAQVPNGDKKTVRSGLRDEVAAPEPLAESRVNHAVYLHPTAIPETHKDLLNLVRLHISELLGMNSPDNVPRKHRLIDLGLDSLMAVELRNRIANALVLAEPLPATLVFDHPTADAIADHIWQTLQSGTSATATDVPPDRMAGRAREIEQLADEDVEALLRARLLSR